MYPQQDPQDPRNLFLHLRKDTYLFFHCLSKRTLYSLITTDIFISNSFRSTKKYNLDTLSTVQSTPTSYIFEILSEKGPIIQIQNYKKVDIPMSTTFLYFCLSYISYTCIKLMHYVLFTYFIKSFHSAIIINIQLNTHFHNCPFPFIFLFK